MKKKGFDMLNRGRKLTYSVNAFSFGEEELKYEPLRQNTPERRTSRDE